MNPVFWQHHPALLYAITLLIAVFSSLFCEGIAQWIYPGLWIAYLAIQKKPWMVLLFAAMACYCRLQCPFAPAEGEGAALFRVDALRPHQSPFHKGWVYQGVATLESGSFPCLIYTHGARPPYPADRGYCLFGKYRRSDRFSLIFKPKQWKEVPGKASFAQERATLKMRYKRFLQTTCSSHPRAAAFLASLSVGETEDRLLQYEYNRLGLQHILAISGFHFGILIFFLSSALSCFFPQKGVRIALLAAVNVYFFFIGSLPGVQRAWIMASLYLIAKLLHRNTSALNLLGCALFLELLMDPPIAADIGFQLSFASCLGILLLHPLIEKKLLFLFPSRQKKDRLSLSLLEKIIYLLSSFLRSSLSLTLAVNSAILPILLVHFHSFPLLSLFYNLFYPFCVSLILSCLLAGLASFLLCPMAGAALLQATAYGADRLLDIAAYPPLSLDYLIVAPHFPTWIAAAVLCALFLTHPTMRMRPLYPNKLKSGLGLFHSKNGKPEPIFDKKIASK